MSQKSFYLTCVIAATLDNPSTRLAHRLGTALETAGFLATAPHLHALDPREATPKEMGRTMEDIIASPDLITDYDLRAIREADFLVAMLEGPTTGGGFEIAYALWLGKPVFLVFPIGLEIRRRSQFIRGINRSQELSRFVKSWPTYLEIDPEDLDITVNTIKSALR